MAKKMRKIELSSEILVPLIKRLYAEKRRLSIY